MRLFLASCLLALLGAVCLAAATSADREKRNIFSDIFSSVKQEVDTIGHTINGAANTVKKFVNTQVSQAKDTVNTVKNDITNEVNDIFSKVKGTVNLVIQKTGDIFNEGIQFVVGAPAAVANQVTQDVLKVTVKLEKAANGNFALLKTAPVLQRGSIINDIIDDTVNFAATVVDDANKAIQYTVTEAKNIEKGVGTIAVKAYQDTYNAAHQAFDKIKGLAGKVDWDTAVLTLIHFMGSPVADAVCQVACVGGAGYLFGPEVMPFAELLCAPLCVAALAKLEDVAEKVAEKAMKEHSTQR